MKDIYLTSPALLFAVALSGLTYSSGSSITYIVGTAITNNNPSTTTGTATTYSVSPALPAGLSLSTTTGVISGTPTIVAARATYTITMEDGSPITTTYDLTITVKGKLH